MASPKALAIAAEREREEAKAAQAALIAEVRRLADEVRALRDALSPAPAQKGAR